MKLEVWKFGGASLADGRAIQKAAQQIAAHRGPLVVVASALAGVTDLLLQGTPAAAAAFRRKHVAGRPRRARHRRAAARDHRRRSTRLSREYQDLCAAVSVLGYVDPRVQDALVSRGERISAQLLAAAVTRLKRRARFVDALEVVQHRRCAWRSDAEAGRDAHARAQGDSARSSASGTVAVVPGYIGRAADGSLTTLGRGGSDLTATLLARSLGARTVVLWKDVPGILTADPRVVPDARLIPQLHHREAAEVAHYGAKVLHPRALIPIAGTTIALHVRSFINPELPGTEVSARQALKGYPVKALAMLPGPGGGHRRRQGHGRRARHCRAHVHRGRCGRPLGLDHLPGLV